MNERGMTAYESTVFLLMIATLLAGIALIAASQFTTSKKFLSGAALEKSLRDTYATAELLPTGSQGGARIFVPKNTSHASVEEDGGRWVLRLTVDGMEYKRTSRVRLVFTPSNLLETPGIHSVLVRKESDESAEILEMQ